MKLARRFSVPLLLWLLSICATKSATVLLPGLTYYEGRENLSGSLAFLVRHNTAEETNSRTAAVIYEFDLAQKKLTKQTDAPSGVFIASNEGDVFCVVYRPGSWFRSEDTNVFLYFPNMQHSLIWNLRNAPKDTLVSAGHVFVLVEGKSGSSILDYDITGGQERAVELFDASKWQYQDYDRIHVPRGQTNTLHFYYSGYGKRLGAGHEYQDGFYTLDIGTGKMQFFADLLEDKDDERYTNRALDTRYIFFEGDSSPITGYKLISSPWDFRESRNLDPKGMEVKVLKKFAKVSEGAYFLAQISPDGLYALVRLQVPISGKSMLRTGWVNTYYLVSASTGEARILLKDELESKTSGAMSVVRWVRKQVAP